ncbi:MAG: hypothetical protein WC346_06440 [Methanogenium sp.]|jgi:hypothetical protein
MSLSSSRLKSALKNTLLQLPVIHPTSKETVTANDIMTDDMKTKLENYVGVLADEIINEIVTNGSIKVALSKHTHIGVTTGVGISGPPQVDGITNVEIGTIE